MCRIKLEKAPTNTNECPLFNLNLCRLPYCVRNQEWFNFDRCPYCTI